MPTQKMLVWKYTGVEFFTVLEAWGKDVQRNLALQGRMLTSHDFVETDCTTLEIGLNIWEGRLVQDADGIAKFKGAFRQLRDVEFDLLEKQHHLWDPNFYEVVSQNSS